MRCNAYLMNRVLSYQLWRPVGSTHPIRGGPVIAVQDKVRDLARRCRILPFSSPMLPSRRPDRAPDPIGHHPVPSACHSFHQSCAASWCSITATPVASRPGGWRLESIAWCAPAPSSAQVLRTPYRWRERGRARCRDPVARSRPSLLTPYPVLDIVGAKPGLCFSAQTSAALIESDLPHPCFHSHSHSRSRSRFRSCSCSLSGPAGTATQSQLLDTPGTAIRR